MANNPIVEFIDSLPFFKEFSAAEREKVVETSGVFAKFKAGNVIISEGEKTAAVYVILKGTVVIQKKIKVDDVKENHISPQNQGDITIKELKSGSIFGEISLISQRPRNTSAIASTNQVVVMKITEKIIEKFNFSIQRKLQNQLIHILVERLEDMNEKFIKLKTSKLEA